MNDYDQLLIISNIIKSQQHLNNPYDENYVRRLKEYPEFLIMPYWTHYYEYVYALNLINQNKIKGKILDFGCGTGHMDILLGRQGATIHGVDLSPMAIDIAKFLRYCEDASVQQRVTFSSEDVTLPPLNEEKYDFVWCTHVMEHIEDPTEIFEGLRKRVVNNSNMLISVPLGYAFNDSGHVHHWMNEKEFYNFFSNFIKVDLVEINHTKSVIRGYFNF